MTRITPQAVDDAAPRMCQRSRDKADLTSQRPVATSLRPVSARDGQTHCAVDPSGGSRSSAVSGRSSANRLLGSRPRGSRKQSSDRCKRSARTAASPPTSTAATWNDRLTSTPAVRSAEGFRTPALCRRAGLDAGPASESLVRRKPWAGMGTVLSGATYGDFGVADGALVGFRGLVARIVLGGGNADDELFGGRGCGRRVWARRLERVCGRFEDIAFLLQRAVGGKGDRRCAGGSAATVMRCRS